MTELLWRLQASGERRSEELLVSAGRGVGSGPAPLREAGLEGRSGLVRLDEARQEHHELEQLRSGHRAQRLEDPHQIRRDSGEVRFCLYTEYTTTPHSLRCFSTFLKSSLTTKYI